MAILSIRGRHPPQEPDHAIEDWLAVAQHHRGYWRRLIRRASAHACQQRDRDKASLTSMPASCSRCSGRVSAIARTQSISAGTQRPGSIGDACSAVCLQIQRRGRCSHVQDPQPGEPVRTLFQARNAPAASRGTTQPPN